MLTRLVVDDSCDILLLQDQLDLTCATVIQTSAQRAVFKHWGQTLVMDWTHNMNTLGFHLGGFCAVLLSAILYVRQLNARTAVSGVESLLATSPSGRGIPMIDFVAPNEKAKALSYILEFLKTNNTEWTSVKPFIINTDFVEWCVLEPWFPSSKVLLCQFHAITYWKKLMQTPRFNMKVKEGAEIEAVVMQMIYRCGWMTSPANLLLSVVSDRCFVRTTQSDCCTFPRDLQELCSQSCSAGYFNVSWKPDQACGAMKSGQRTSQPATRRPTESSRAGVSTSFSAARRR